MRVHRFNERVIVRLRSDVPDAFVGVDSSYRGGERWAEVKPVSGISLRHGEQVAEGVTHRVTMRRCVLTGDHEIVRHGGTVLRVRRAYDTTNWGTETTVAECEEYQA